VYADVVAKAIELWRQGRTHTEVYEALNRLGYQTQVGGRLVRRGGAVSVEAVNITPEMDATVQAHHSDLLLLVPEPKPESIGDTP
jgi:hypothetical protein